MRGLVIKLFGLAALEVFFRRVNVIRPMCKKSWVDRSSLLRQGEMPVRPAATKRGEGAGREKAA